MFNCFNILITSNITNMFSLVRDTHHHNTRSASNNNFNAPIPRTEILKRCLLYHGPVLWNSISSDIRDQSNILSFKSLFKRCFYMFVCLVCLVHILIWHGPIVKQL